MIRVAIVGSRDFRSERLVRSVVRDLAPDAVVITGGARGVDSWAEDEARKRGLLVVVHRADWRGAGRGAGMLRNTKIVIDCDSVIAFWDGKSRGTADTIAKARKAGKAVEVIQ